jgi:hypothetical protein
LKPFKDHTKHAASLQQKIAAIDRIFESFVQTEFSQKFFPKLSKSTVAGNGKPSAAFRFTWDWKNRSREKPEQNLLSSTF